MEIAKLFFSLEILVFSFLILSLSQGIYHYEIEKKHFVEIESRKFTFLDNMLSPLENFGKFGKQPQQQKTIHKIFEWGIIIFILCLAITTRNVLELRTIFIQPLMFYLLFGFYIFIFGGATLSFYFLLKTDLLQVIKITAIGISLFIQIPYIVDFYILNNVRIYNWVLWQDILIMFGSFFLHPSLVYSYTFGHIVMFFLLLFFSCIIIFYRSYYYKPNLKRDAKFVYLRVGIMFLLVYLMLGIGISLGGIVYSLSTFFIPGIHISATYIILANAYLIPLILIIILKIIQDEKKFRININQQKKQKLSWISNKSILRIILLVSFIIFYQIFSGIMVSI